MKQTPKSLNDILLMDEPEERVNKQLFANSEVSAVYAQEVEAGRAVGLSEREGFFNAKDPNLAILTEKPEHRLVIFLKARGHNNTEIAQASGFTLPWVGQILRQPWARARLAEEINNAGRDELATIIEGAAKDSMFTLVELRDDENSPASVKANVSQYLVDRFLGKPKQSIEQKIGEVSNLTDEQLASIVSSTRTATATQG